MSSVTLLPRRARVTTRSSSANVISPSSATAQRPSSPPSPFIMPATFVTPSPLPSSPHRAHPPRRPRHPVCALSYTRRHLLQTLLATTPLHLPRPASAIWPFSSSFPQSPPSPSTASTVFSVLPTTIADVNLLPLDFDSAINACATADVVFLGEHHNSLVDHALQARIISAMRSISTRPLAVGLEMVQSKFQPVLDKFVAGRLSELDLYLETEWETRWVWPYELYLPVLRACRRYNIPLIALSIDSETLSKLREKGGITNLSGFEMRTHVGDASVFAAMMRESGFKNYVNECITPSYAAHYKLGLLNEATNFNSYFTSRMFRDEAMATRAVRHVLSNDGTLICLLGADHVKFEYGVTGRVRRQLVAERNKIREREIMLSEADGRSTDHLPEVADPLLKTVMLNPGPADAYDAKDGSLKLEMPVGNIPVPIADFLWFSSAAEAKPRRQIRRPVLPPIERLTSS